MDECEDNCGHSQDGNDSTLAVVGDENITANDHLDKNANSGVFDKLLMLPMSTLNSTVQLNEVELFLLNEAQNALNRFFYFLSEPSEKVTYPRNYSIKNYNDDIDKLLTSKISQESKIGINSVNIHQPMDNGDVYEQLLETQDRYLMML